MEMENRLVGVVKDIAMVGAIIKEKHDLCLDEILLWWWLHSSTHVIKWQNYTEILYPCQFPVFDIVS